MLATSIAAAALAELQKARLPRSGVCPACAGSRRQIDCRETARGNVIVERYGPCTLCATEHAPLRGATA